jgi:methionyl-tRNA synthetase
MARILVAVAWPYANGPFHLGHLAGAYLPADLFARYHRLRGDEVLMVSGSDMHGTPILVTAESEGATPEEIATRYDAVNRDALERLGLTYDVFTTTHTVLHERAVQDFFLALLRNGYVDRRTETNAYCPKQERFLPDRYLIGRCPHCGYESARGDECPHCGRMVDAHDLGDPKCRLDGTPAEFRPSEHFYLRLDLLQPAIQRYLADKTDWRTGVLESARTFLAAGLRPTPITRDLDWGIPIPLDGYATKRFYVWFDAVIGYLSASREWAIRTHQPEAWRRFWSPGESARHYYFLGKDNIWHHTIVWPGMLLGHADLRTPDEVAANQWLVIGGEKLAKSGSTEKSVFVPALLAEYAPDVIRFYAAVHAPQNHDTEFSWEEFHQLADTVLANQWGNLVQRLLVFARDRFDGRIPEPPPGWDPETSEVGRRLRDAHERIAREFEGVRLKEALDRALEEVRDANRRFHEARPWQADDESRRRTVYEGLWFVRAAALWLSPVIPFSSEQVWKMLGEPNGPRPGDWERGLERPEPGRALGEVRPLFPRREISRPAVAPRSAPPAGAGASASAGTQALEIRAGTIVEVEPHPSADRLYLLRVDIGEAKPRTVVAGLRPFYRAEQLRDRRVALLANLESRTIRRVTSQGMILAAEHDDRVELLRPPDGSPSGSRVVGAPERSPTLRFADFEKTPLLVGRVTGPGPDGRVRVDVGGGREVLSRGTWATGISVVVRLPSVDANEGEILAFGPGRPLAPAPDLPPGSRVR